jgi:predicted O-methyltransferase YrrM
MNNKPHTPEFSFLQRIKLFTFGIINWDIPTYTTADELFKLYKLTKLLKENSTIVEIGSYTGASTLMIGKGLKKGSKLYCIDTWKNDAMTEGYYDTFEIFKKNTHPIREKIIIIKSKSTDQSIKFKKEIDLLFIDGDHSYEGVKKDFDIWFKKLKTDGIIIMHDIGWSDGVIKVINENIKPCLERYDMLPNMFWGWKK